MPIYLSGKKIQVWSEVNETSSTANGAENGGGAITLLRTNTAYVNYMLQWCFDNRTSYPWYDMQGGTGFGFGILNGTSGDNNYTYRDIYSNGSSVTSLGNTSFRITNSTGDTKYLSYRIQAWAEPYQ